MKKRRKKYPKVPSALHEPRRTKNGLEQLNLVLHSHSPTHPLPPRPRTISFIARCTQPSAHSVFWHHREKLFTASALNWATCHPTSRVRQLHMFPTTKQVYTMTSKGTPPLYPSPPPSPLTCLGNESGNVVPRVTCPGKGTRVGMSVLSCISKPYHVSIHVASF